MNNRNKPSINSSLFNKINQGIEISRTGSMQNIIKKIQILIKMMNYRVDIYNYLSIFSYRLFGLLMCLYDYNIRYQTTLPNTPINAPLQDFINSISEYNQQLMSIMNEISTQQHFNTNKIGIQQKYVPILRELVYTIFNRVTELSSNLLDSLKNMQNKNESRYLIGNITANYINKLRIPTHSLE